MRRQTQEKIVAISHRLYLLLLVTCQPEFRRRYGREMGQVFRDHCGEARRQSGLVGLALWWGRALSDLAGTAVATHVYAFERGEVEMKRILRLTAQGVFGCGGILLLFYTMFKRPMPYWNAGVLLCGVIACLSVALGLTWATAYRENGRTRNARRHSRLIADQYRER
jgi:hypothetical protein